MSFRDSSIEGITFRGLYMGGRSGGAYSLILDYVLVYAGRPGRPGELVIWIFHRPICCLGGEISQTRINRKRIHRGRTL